MTKERFNELASEARKRHRHDPAWNPDATEEDKFWHEWSGWMKKKSMMGDRQSLSYKGRNDPTAMTAIGIVEREERETRKEKELETRIAVKASKGGSRQ